MNKVILLVIAISGSAAFLRSRSEVQNPDVSVHRDETRNFAAVDSSPEVISVQVGVVDVPLALKPSELETYKTVNVLPPEFEIDAVTGIPVPRKTDSGSEDYLPITQLPEGFKVDAQSGLIKLSAQNDEATAVYTQLEDIPSHLIRRELLSSMQEDGPYQQVPAPPKGFSAPSGAN